jgi:hypothetical protein
VELTLLRIGKLPSSLCGATQDKSQGRQACSLAVYRERPCRLGTHQGRSSLLRYNIKNPQIKKTTHHYHVKKS